MAENIVLNTTADLAAGVTVPANHTADYTDAKGNIVAHFAVTRPYPKRCKIDHFADHGYEFPITVSFMEHEPEQDASAVDDDFGGAA